MSDSTLIEVGQVWKALSDGREIRITSYVQRWDDCQVLRVDGRGGWSIYGVNLRKRYVLKESA